jgi:hypothetical protein
MAQGLKVYLPDNIGDIVSRTAEVEGVSISGLLSRIIADQIGSGVDDPKTSSIAPFAYEAHDAVRFNVVLPKKILNILEARAVRQGHTRMRYIASVLTSHASIEPVYDNAQQADITRMIDKVHALAISTNLLRTSVEQTKQIPSDLEGRLSTILEVCGKLLTQLNQMRHANVGRWGIR